MNLNLKHHLDGQIESLNPSVQQQVSNLMMKQQQPQVQQQKSTADKSKTREENLVFKAQETADEIKMAQISKQKLYLPRNNVKISKPEMPTQRLPN